MDNSTVLDAKALLKKGNLQAALRLYEEAIRAEPKNALAYHNAATIHADLGNNNHALDLSAKALELDSSFVLPHVTRAYVLDRLGKKEESRTEIQKALEKDPDSTESMCCLGIFLLAENRIDDAKRYLEKVVEINPSHYLAQYHLSMVYYSLKDVKQVVRQSLVLFRLRPNITNFLRLPYVFSRFFRLINLLILLIAAALSLWVGPKLILTVTFLLVSMSFLGGIFIGFLAKGTQRMEFVISFALSVSLGILGLMLYFIANNFYAR